ncbi:MAG TPA: NAD-dependent epimerase/dehydratase family protein, partial [Saprospiraceae bacterium]|nr:NAD-dependent epimerase/dehydratase family protein [Saprospiraceae bacterium]
MKTHLVSGGCGFVGRNMVKRLYNTTNDQILFIDDLSVGTHPNTWLAQSLQEDSNGVQYFGNDKRLIFIQCDFREWVMQMAKDPNYIKIKYGLDIDQFADVFHFAAIVGGRAKIDGDPLLVARDLSIDAEFFFWITRQKPERVLYPSSSAAYPINLQTEGGAIALKESDINFNDMGQPDMTYGWTKLTGEFLAK